MDKRPCIEFKNISKSFGEKTVLEDINLSIYENEITTIIGKSGTGKSVLLKHMIGLLKQDSGDIYIEGKDLKVMKRKGEWDKYRRKFSYMFQGNALFDSMDVYGNIAFPLMYSTGMPEDSIKKKVMEKIEQAELSDVINKYPAELSGGMQKRVALARALVTDPEIVLFDEPTTGQDLVRRNTILSMITHLKKTHGFTAILVSHDIPDIFFISDRIIILWEGTIAFQGTYEEAIRLDHPVIEELMKSLEGFQDELTGLLSKQMFRSRYSMTFIQDRKKTTGIGILFSVNFEELEKKMGPSAAIEVVKLLGEYINMNMAPSGAFSTRHRREEIFTIIPNFTGEEAEEVMDSFAEIIRGEIPGLIEKFRQQKKKRPDCFDLIISAGVTTVKHSDDIDSIIRKASALKRVIGRYQCGSEGIP